MKLTLDLDALPYDPAWPTRHADLALALSIMARHQRLNGGTLRLLEDWGEADDETLWVKLPAWLVELNQQLREVHGERAAEVASRVLSVLLPAPARGGLAHQLEPIFDRETAEHRWQVIREVTQRHGN